MLRILKITLCALSISAFLHTVETWADPVITSVGGTFREGETIVINGSGFGSKEHAGPLKWDNFENGTNAQVVPTRGGDYSDPSAWGNMIKAGNVTYTTQNNRMGSVFCSKNDMDDYYADNQRSAYLKWGTDTTSLRKIYITFWVRFTFGTNFQRHQVKLWRLESHNDESMKFAQYNWGPDDPSHYYQRGTGVGGPASSYGFDGKLPYQENQWFQVEFQAEQSNQSVSDGSIEIWHSHPLGSQSPMVKVVDLPDVMTRNVPYYWDRVTIGECTTNLDHYVMAGVINYFDNFYVDNSWARVVIGNASTYDTCTRREIQIPSVWLDNSVTVTANAISLPFGASYLYIVDENGRYNATGYPVTIGPSPKWLAGVVDEWQNGKISRDDLNKAVYCYIKGEAPSGDPMAELSEEDIGNALSLFLSQ